MFLYVCNVAALAREYNLHKDALHAHRKNHSPARSETAPEHEGPVTWAELEAAIERLYADALDHISLAEAGMECVVTTDPVTGVTRREHPTDASILRVARAIREARLTLGLLANLVLDRPPSKAPPTETEPAPESELSIGLQKELAYLRQKRVAEQARDSRAEHAARRRLRTADRRLCRHRRVCP